MIIKPRVGRREELDELRRLLELAQGQPKADVVRRFRRMIAAGEEAERQTAFRLNDAFAESHDFAVIHDLRVVGSGNRVAQMDHLVIHRSMTLFVIETKSARATVRILANGEFEREEDDGSRTGNKSPLQQVERQSRILKTLLPETMFGRKLGCESIVAYGEQTVIERPESALFDTSCVVKNDMLVDWLHEVLKKKQALIGHEREWPSPAALRDFAKEVAMKHVPAPRADYAQRFGVDEERRPAAAQSDPAPVTAPPVFPRVSSPAVVEHRARTFNASSSASAIPFPVRSPKRRVPSGPVAITLAVVVFLVGSLFWRDGEKEKPVAPTAAAKTAGRTQKPAGEVRKPPRPTQVSAVVTGGLREGEDCFVRKRYDCAISSANAVLRVEPQNAMAAGLKQRAVQEQRAAMDGISIR